MNESIEAEWLRAILLLGVAFTVWVIIRLKHEHANVSLEWLEGLVEGYTIYAVFWCGKLGLALIAKQYGVEWILHLTLLLLFTKFFGVVTFIEVSSTIMSIFWGLEKQSKGKLDYRIHVVAGIALYTSYLVLLYLHNGFPPNPITLP